MMHDSTRKTHDRCLVERWLGIAALLIVSACSTGSDVPTVRPSAAQPQRIVELAALRIFDNGAPIIVLYRNGLLEERGRPLGTMHEDGRFFDLSGQLRAEMKADGRISIEGGEILIEEDGTASVKLTGVKDSSIRVDDTGRVVGAHNDLRIEGLRPELRRTAILALLLPDIIRLQQRATVQ